AGLLLVAFLLLALIQGLLVGEPTAMVRAALVELPLSVLGTVVLVAVTELLVGVTDAASSMVLAGAPGGLGHFLSGCGSAATAASAGVASTGAAKTAGTDLAGLLGGATLMLLAAFMPFVILRLLPILEAAVVAQGISRAPVRAGQGGLQAAYYTQGLSRLAG